MGVMPSSSSAISHQIETAEATGMLVITNRGITSFPIKGKNQTKKNLEKLKRKCSPRRGIEPRSPA
jgi:hypothetical protein